MNTVQNVIVSTLNRPGHVFEIEGLIIIHNNQSPQALRNFLLSTESRRFTPPRTRCGFDYFGFNLQGSVTYCSTMDPFAFLGPSTGSIRPLANVV